MERFKSDRKTSIPSFWRDSLFAEAKSLTTLCYMRIPFFPLEDEGPTPPVVDRLLLFLSCVVSPSDG